MTELAVTIRPERPSDDPDILRLHERAFGPGRYARTAERLREGETSPVADLSFVALVGTLLVGSVRVWPILVARDPAFLLGPLAVEPAFEKRGIGAGLMEAALEAGRSGGHALMLLVGDEPYYARFGFRRVPPGRMEMPGPVDPARVLGAELAEGALERMGGRIAAGRG